VRFEAPAPRIRGIWLQHLFTDRETEVLIQVTNRTREKLLLREHIAAGHEHLARIPATNRAGDVLEVSYRIASSRKDQFPAIVEALKRSQTEPRFPVTVELDGSPLSSDQPWPLFQLRYEHPLHHLFLLWPLLLGGFIALQRKPAGRVVRLGFLTLLALLSCTTGFLVWMHAYESDWSRFDPEHNLAYANALAGWAGNRAPAVRESLTAWIGNHPRAPFPLLPALAALLSLLGMPVPAALFFLVGLSTFGLLLLTDWALVDWAGIDSRPATALLTIFATHAAFSQGALGPSAQPVFSALALAGCVFLLHRSRTAFAWPREVAFGVFLLSLALSHPCGIAAALFFVAFSLILEPIRSRVIRLDRLARTLEFSLVPAAVILALCTLAFDWSPAWKSYRHEAIQQQHLSTWGTWLPPFFTTVAPLLVLAWPGFRPGDFRRVDVLVLLAWSAFYLGATAIALEPFQLRTFLPLLGPLVMVAGFGFQRLADRRPTLFTVGTLAIAAAHLWAVGFLLQQRALPDSLAARLIHW